MAPPGKDKKPSKQVVMRGTPQDSETPTEAVLGLRLCLLRKWANFKGYGFDLSVDPNVEQHIITQVDIDSPAELGGVRKNDRVVEVNGIPVDGKGHLEVVDLIQRQPKTVQLLVIDPETEKEFNGRHEKPSSQAAGVVRLQSPTEHPKSIAREARQQVSAKTPAPRAADFRFVIEDSNSGSRNSSAAKRTPDKASKASKPTRTSKATKPAAKAGKASGSGGPVVATSISRKEAELYRKQEEARTQLQPEADVDATQEDSDSQPANRTEYLRYEAQPRLYSVEPVAEAPPQGPYVSAPAFPSYQTFPPPYYVPEQNYYSGFIEGQAMDAAGYYWTPDADLWAGMVPFAPEYSAAPSPYTPSSQTPLSGAYSPYQAPELFWTPTMPPSMPYQAPTGMPMTPLPFYGYPGNYAPGYTGFLPPYSGYPNYPAFPYAGPNLYGQPVQDVRSAERAPARRRITGTTPGRRDGPGSVPNTPREKRQDGNPGAC